MDNINKIYKKEKELFFSSIKKLLFGVALISLIVFLYLSSQSDKQKVYEAFVNGNEIVCDKFIVSKDFGYEFETKEAHKISNGKNIFILENCNMK